MDLEAKEGTEDIDAKDMEPICKFLDYIPLCKGKEKVTKDPDAERFLIHKPLLPESITFEGPRLVRVSHLKMEDWDLVENERFPHLKTENYMKQVYYKESSVTALEPVEWIRGVNKSGLLNLLWEPHYHHSKRNIIIIKQFLTLVHDGCLWLSMPIPITDMLIHQIMLLSHSCLNPAKDFGRKTSERDLAKMMKEKFKLVKKPRGYSTTSITNPMVEITTQILPRKVMRKFHPDDVLAPMISLAA